MQAVDAKRNTVISHGRLRMSLRSRPMVGSALARMVLSSAPMNTGSIAPMTNSRRSLWVSGLAAAVGAFIGLLRLARLQRLLFDQDDGDERHRHGRGDREEHLPVG